MDWVTITIGCIIFSVFGLLFAIISNIKFSPKPDGGSKEVDHEVTRDMFNKVITFFKKFDSDMARSVCSDMFYNSIKTELSGLTRFGIRKDISFAENPETAKSNVNLKLNDGKNSFTVDILYGDYKEKYISTADNKELYSKNIPVSSVALYMIQSEDAQSKESFYCSNCGKQLSIDADSVVCPACGTKYNTESNKWSLTDLQAVNYKKSNSQSGLIGLGVIVLMVLSLVGGLFIPEALFNMIMAICNGALVIATLFYIYYINKALKPLKDISKHDPNFSRMVFQSRIDYLVNLYFKARYFNPQLIKPFASKELVDRLAKDFSEDNELIVDLDIGKKLITKLEVSGEHMVATIKLKLTSVIVNKNRRVKKKKSNAEIKLARHMSARTKVYTDADYITCEGCGANINLTADGKCKYCGNPIDVSKYDWVIREFN